MRSCLNSKIKTNYVLGFVDAITQLLYVCSPAAVRTLQWTYQGLHPSADSQASMLCTHRTVVWNAPLAVSSPFPRYLYFTDGSAISDRASRNITPRFKSNFFNHPADYVMVDQFVTRRQWFGLRTSKMEPLLPVHCFYPDRLCHRVSN